MATAQAVACVVCRLCRVSVLMVLLGYVRVLGSVYVFFDTTNRRRFQASALSVEQAILMQSN